MTRARTLLLATSLLAAALALVPTASADSAAAFQCKYLGPGGGGLVGRTVEYVANLEYAVCAETADYAFDVCVIVLGPTLCAIV